MPTNKKNPPMQNTMKARSEAKNILKKLFIKYKLINKVLIK
jgi:hypothetical protein